MSDVIKVKDRYFKSLIPYQTILSRVTQMAKEIEQEYKDLNPVFLPVLNGSFMFAADLMKIIQFPSEIEFINAKSYQGTTTTGVVNVETYFKKTMKDRHIIILEDIVDTGLTIQKLTRTLEAEEPKSIEVASILIKPNNFQVPVTVKYHGFKIKNEFVVGYGLDYDGMGRNILGIYQEVEIT